MKPTTTAPIPACDSSRPRLTAEFVELVVDKDPLGDDGEAVARVGPVAVVVGRILEDYF
jgi:hypothetical protein